MKLLMLCGAVALITCASSSVDGDILLEMREEFAQMKAEMKAENAQMKTEISELKAETAELKAHRNATTAGKLEFFVDGRTVCPDGTAEANATKGRVLLGKPDGGNTGEVFNHPLDAGEVGRSPPHSHAVAVDGPGHTHVGIVEDPGHLHLTPLYNDAGRSGAAGHDFHEDEENYGDHIGNLPTKSAKTGISIGENLAPRQVCRLCLH
jgi:hypothetical protein